MTKQGRKKTRITDHHSLYMYFFHPQFTTFASSLCFVASVKQRFYSLQDIPSQTRISELWLFSYSPSPPPPTPLLPPNLSPPGLSLFTLSHLTLKLPSPLLPRGFSLPPLNPPPSFHVYHKQTPISKHICTHIKRVYSTIKDHNT